MTPRSDGSAAPGPAASPHADEGDRRVVAELLGREPRGAIEVVVRDRAGRPAVIRNPPLFDDGRPMPTLYWLVDPVLVRRVGTLEAEGGVRRAEQEVDPAALTAAHALHASRRDRALADLLASMGSPPMAPGDPRPAPRGGVGGTRTGVKCLHAHLASWLADGVDPVGEWTVARLREDQRWESHELVRPDGSGVRL